MLFTRLLRVFFRPLGSLVPVLALLSSCQDVVSVTVPEGQPLLAVDGAITDQPGPYTVTLTKTGAYFTNASLPRISGAVVQLCDSQGNQEVLREQAPGTYVTSQLQGRIGNSYVLTIKAEGEEYEARTEIRRTMTIDSLGQVYRQKQGTDTAGYRIVYHSQELPGQGDYVRFKRYKNGRLLNQPGDLSTSSDRLADGNYLRIEFGRPNLQRGDVGRIEINSLSEDYFHFLEELGDQIDNVGIFANPPANVRTNVKNVNAQSPKVAVGYFAGYAVRSASITIR